MEAGMMVRENVTSEKRERFHRIAESRANKIASMVRLLGNCTNKSNYSYTDDEVKDLFAFIEKEVKHAKARFSSSDKNDEGVFKFR